MWRKQRGAVDLGRFAAQAGPQLEALLQRFQGAVVGGDGGFSGNHWHLFGPSLCWRHCGLDLIWAAWIFLWRGDAEAGVPIWSKRWAVDRHAGA